jgi:hypothetical protein
VTEPPTTPGDQPERTLSPEARRALAEAAERRAAQAQATPPVEHGGPRGLEPTRYGDWEKKGLAVDF